MPGPIPKPPGLRQRRNRASTKAILPTAAEAAKQNIPPLPTPATPSWDGNWHEHVVAWWESVWHSPMAAEYLEPDKRGLILLAYLQQSFWTARTNEERFKFAAEIRQQEVRFGLTPIDRRRLQWEVEKGESAAVRTATRRKRKRANPKKDPREVLKLA